MKVQLTPEEIATSQQLLETYQPAQKAIAALKRHNGNLAASFDEISGEQTKQLYGGQSLWESTLKVLREEICGDEGFQAQFQNYSKNPGSTPLLTGLIVALINLSGIPLDPAIATIIVLYLLKIGLKIFCEYTQPT